MTRRPDPPICVALDVPDLATALRCVDALKGAVPVFKVGLELFTAAGPDAVRAIRDRGCDVFLDLKVNDIPKQAAGAVRSAAAIGVGYITVHGNGGRTMVRAAVDAAGSERIAVLVVSVLTSLDDGDLRDIGVQRSITAQVEAMADLADDVGAPGLVLGAGEVASVRSAHSALFLVTPGIRPATTAVGDQRRVSTPGAAITAGADMLVLGRAVTDAPDPRWALDAITTEIADARARGLGRLEVKRG